jgi:LCP family protein required for cell wall assembly
MSFYKRVLVLVIAFSLFACSLPGMLGLSPDSSGLIVGKSLLFQVPPNATPTATPFQPLPPTPTYLPTVYPTKTPGGSDLFERTWADYPGPTSPSDIPIPPPVGLLPQPDGQVNIMLLGSDQRPNDGGFRTDTILLLTLNPEAGTASLTSFPRDLYVYIPGWTMQRINTAFPHGGFDTLALTMEYNFGVRPDYYVMINFWSFQQAIDSLGGITVDVAVSLTDWRSGYGYYTVPAGQVHMDGETALWYVRSRYSTSDFERTQRQQEVIQAIFQRLLNLDVIQRASELYEIYRQNVITDLTLQVITPLLPLAVILSDTSRISQYFISRQEVTPYRTSSGAQVLIPIPEAVVAVMRQALNSP